MEYKYCSIGASKLLSHLGMVSMEAVFDNEGSFGYRSPTFGGNLWFKIKYQDALIWLSEHFNCNIWIYQECPELVDLWKVRILPGGPVFEGGFAIPIENNWAVVAEVAISTACVALLESRGEYRDGVRYVDI